MVHLHYYLFLDVYDSWDNLLGSDTAVHAAGASGMMNLSVDTALGGIAYAIFGGNGPLGNTVYADNFTYIPVPGALLLGSLGMGLVPLIRRRKLV